MDKGYRERKRLKRIRSPNIRRRVSPAIKADGAAEVSPHFPNWAERHAKGNAFSGWQKQL
jgi:hypothetical protein